MTYRVATAAAAIVFGLTACGGGSDEASSDADFAGPSLDSAAICDAIPYADLEPLFEFASGVYGEPSTIADAAACNYTASNADASLLVNASVSIENEGGAEGFASVVEKWEQIADVVSTPGIGDDAVTVTDANGHDSMFVLDGDRVLSVKASTVSSDKSIVASLPQLAEMAVAAL